jgi:hypothetical protein
MHPGRPFYWTLLLQPEIDLDLVSGLYSLGSCLDIFVHVGGPNALLFVISLYFLPYLAHICAISMYALQNNWNTKTYGIC